MWSWLAVGGRTERALRPLSVSSPQPNVETDVQFVWRVRPDDVLGFDADGVRWLGGRFDRFNSGFEGIVLVLDVVVVEDTLLAGECDRGLNKLVRAVWEIHHQPIGPAAVVVGDLAHVAGDRGHRVVEQIEPDEQVLDMFAGVGPFAIPAASRGASAVAVDLNETAVDYCRENARRNGVVDAVTAVAGDVRGVADDYDGWADRLVMNLPHSATEFVATAAELAGEACVPHHYQIQHDH